MKLLIVANRTLGGDALAAAIAERTAKERCEFHVLVPIDSSATALVALGSTAVDMMPPPNLDLPDERRIAEERLAAGLELLSAHGPATGEVIVDADTVAAVCAATRDRGIDEVIVSTLPTTVSRWLRQDLPHRIARKVEVPVTVVTSRA